MSRPQYLVQIGVYQLEQHSYVRVQLALLDHLKAGIFEQVLEPERRVPSVIPRLLVLVPNERNAHEHVASRLHHPINLAKKDLGSKYVFQHLIADHIVEPLVWKCKSLTAIKNVGVT